MKNLQLTSYLIVNIECFSPNIGSGQGYLFLLLLFKIVLKVFGCAIKPKQEIKGTLIGKEEVKLFLFAGNTITYRKSYRITKKPPELIIECSNIVGYKTNIKINYISTF